MMTEEQIQVIKDAHSNLSSALLARNKNDIEVHDWDSHFDAIVALESTETADKEMTGEQIQVIKDAYSNLFSALLARNKNDIEVHDWDSHFDTILELQKCFDFIKPI